MSHQAYKFLHLETGRIVSRKNFNIMPITGAVIARVEDLELRSPRSISTSDIMGRTIRRKTHPTLTTTLTRWRRNPTKIPTAKLK